MLNHALLVKIIARPDRAEDVAQFLADALPLANAEDFTPAWFAIRVDKVTFYVFDAFATVEDRTRHLEGAIAQALMANAETLLSEAPSIVSARVLGSKMSAPRWPSLPQG
ncbi:MAG: putative quinol monooxygenase [Bradymonadia bacterium]